MRLALLACLSLITLWSAAGESPAAVHRQHGVTVTVTVEEVGPTTAVLVGRFVPDTQKPPLHLYSKDTPTGREGELGAPTVLRLKAGEAVSAAGPLTADQVPTLKDDLSLYPEGPVTLRLPIALPAGAAGTTVPVSVQVGYMACTAFTCNIPVRPQDTALTVQVPVRSSAGTTPTPAPLALGGFTGMGVTVTLALERGAGDAAVLIGTFTPKVQADPLHVYDLALRPEQHSNLGTPTRLDLDPSSGIAATGLLTADRSAAPDKSGLPVYPAGPVTLRLPIRLPTTTDGAVVKAAVLVTFQACTADTCLIPVRRQPIAVQVPTVSATAPQSTGGVDEATIRRLLAGEREVTRELVADEVVKTERRLSQKVDALAERRPRIHWRHPTTVADLKSLIAEAHAAGKLPLLDFTGPSCSNCQDMAKNVFTIPAVRAAWNAQVPIEIDTDRYAELARWQQEHFQTQARPLYAWIKADGTSSAWSDFFARSITQPKVDRLVGFLGGAPSSGGPALGANRWDFLVLAVFGGLFTLLMPCTYPMIPFTVNFFAKQAAAGARLVPLAAAYAFGIIACFTGLGVLVAGVFRANLSTLAGDPWTNLVFAAVFVVLGLSLLGAFLLRLPAGLDNVIGGGRGGYIGALLMGLTFAVTAFSCTAPFAGSVLAQAVATGSWLGAVIGMAVYASAIAIPFFILAIIPGLLARLPKAGQWMNEFKVIGGLVEIAFALKFLAICDDRWGWGVVGRTLTLTVWTVAAAACAAYVLGRIRIKDDEPVGNLGLGRLAFAGVFACLALWFAAGVFGQNLGLVESWFPGDEAP